MWAADALFLCGSWASCIFCPMLLYIALDRQWCLTSRPTSLFSIAYYISMDIITHVFLFLYSVLLYCSTLCAIVTRSINATCLLAYTPWVKKGRHYTLLHIFAKYLTWLDLHASLFYSSSQYEHYKCTINIQLHKLHLGLRFRVSVLKSYVISGFFHNLSNLG